MSETENNKRIAKNTLYLYFRMIIFLVIGLFTARVTLNALGVHDYGLLNVVGGVMGFLGYFSQLLSEGTTRFLTVGLGKGDTKQLTNIFSACSAIHIVLALFTLALGETIGLWFVNNKLIIDPERLFAANWVYQLSLFSACLSITQTPYIASVIAHEKMSAFAFMSIFDVAAKLIVVCLLLYVNTDKLILYSTFYFIVGLLTFLIYRIYCLRKFEECNLKLCWDVPLYKQIWNYVGWNSIGAFAFISNNQGITVILNLFFSTVVNAARGIATNVSNYVYGFVSNFLTATKPQIMKYYAVGDYVAMNRLICNSAKFSSYLLIIVGLPVALETHFLINLWLGQVPEYVIIFIRLTLIQLFFQSIDLPIGYGIHAFGKMKLPNLTSSFAYLSVLPITYVALKMGASPVIAYILSSISFPLALMTDLWIMNRYSKINVGYYLTEVPLKSIIIILLSLVLPLVSIFSIGEGWTRFILTSAMSVITSIAAAYSIGLNKEQRKQSVTYISSKAKKVFCRR